MIPGQPNYWDCMCCQTNWRNWHWDSKWNWTRAALKCQLFCRAFRLKRKKNLSHYINQKYSDPKDDTLLVTVTWRKTRCAGCEILVASIIVSEVIGSPIKRKKSLLQLMFGMWIIFLKITEIINHWIMIIIIQMISFKKVTKVFVYAVLCEALWCHSKIFHQLFCRGQCSTVYSWILWPIFQKVRRYDSRDSIE